MPKNKVIDKPDTDAVAWFKQEQKKREAYKQVEELIKNDYDTVSWLVNYLGNEDIIPIPKDIRKCLAKYGLIDGEDKIARPLEITANFARICSKGPHEWHPIFPAKERVLNIDIFIENPELTRIIGNSLRNHICLDDYSNKVEDRVHLTFIGDKEEKIEISVPHMDDYCLMEYFPVDMFELPVFIQQILYWIFKNEEAKEELSQEINLNYVMIMRSFKNTEVYMNYSMIRDRKDEFLIESKKMICKNNELIISSSRDSQLAASFG